ncbi:peptidylprolyl isomerase [Leptothermofonsia sp. ETS-13]|uniref:peptidylprolyl isomerase n=1 Tax=Leptothermofonsia sp. ETS-13 TaxID=3035696 RepID=UPI003BA33645
MSSPTLLLVNEKPIDLNQAIDYLQMAGTFQEFLLDILCQHALTEAVRSQSDSSEASQSFNLPAETIEQSLIDFRTENELADADDFQDWLASNGVTYETFRQQFVWNLTLNHLKNQISQPQLTEYFQKRKPFLDQVVLSWIGVETENRAKNLRRKLNWGTKFDHLIATQMNSNNNDDNGLAIPLSQGELPDELRDAIEATQPGEVIGPLLIGDRWYVFRVEALQPAELDEALEAQLKDELFEQWLIEKVQQMDVTLQLTNQSTL